MAHPTRFERVAFAFGGENASATNRGTLHYRLLSEANRFSGRGSNGGFWSRKVENT